jgi:HSP20 family molecular chaperone IbpA
MRRAAANRAQSTTFYSRRVIMANLTLFDPTTNDLIDPFFRRFFASRDLAAPFETQAIRIDVSETPESYTVQAEIPA